MVIWNDSDSDLLQYFETNSVPVTLYPQQIPQGFIWDRTLSRAVKTRRITVSEISQHVLLLSIIKVIDWDVRLTGRRHGSD